MNFFNFTVFLEKNSSTAFDSPSQGLIEYSSKMTTAPGLTNGQSSFKALRVGLYKSQSKWRSEILSPGCSFKKSFKSVSTSLFSIINLGFSGINLSWSKKLVASFKSEYALSPGLKPPAIFSTFLY